MCYLVCWMVHIKYPLLLIEKHRPCSGGHGFPISLSGPLHVRVNQLAVLRRISQIHHFAKVAFLFIYLFYRLFTHVKQLHFASVYVRAFAHGAMGRRVDPPWCGPIELFLVPASAPRLV